MLLVKRLHAYSRSCLEHYLKTFAAAAQNGQKTVAASLKSSPCPDIAEESSPLYDVRSQPTGEAAEDGNLTN